MNRRTFVRRLTGVGAAAGVAGCLGRGYGGTTPANVPTGQTGPPACPTFSSGVDVAVCADEANSTTAVSLEPESRTFAVVANDGRVETLALTLHNRSRRAFATAPGAWTVVRRTGADWTEAATGDGTDESVRIEPGGSHVWSLSLTPHPTPLTERTTFVTTDLDEGTYLFAVVGRFEVDDRKLRVECHARFELEEQATTEPSGAA